MIPKNERLHIKLLRIAGARRFYIDSGRDRIGFAWNIFPSRFGVYILIVWPKRLLITSPWRR